MTSSILLLKASDGSANASMATVTASRSAGATVIDVDTVTGIPTKFSGSMGTPHTFTDPVTSETITVISEATAVDFEGHVDAGTLVIDTIAPGYTDAGSEVGDVVVIKPTTQWADNLAAVLQEAHDDDGKLKAAVPVTNATALTVEPLTGWINDPNTFVYVSGTGTINAVIKVAGVDVTDHLQAGTPFVVVQGGVSKYGYILDATFSTDTTITAMMSATNGTVDNSGITNATITSFKFGLPDQPGFGFPCDPARFTVTVTSTSNRSTTSGSFASLTDSITVPRGAGLLYLKAAMDIAPGSSNVAQQLFATLSSDGSTETNPNLTLQVVGGFNATGSAKEWANVQSASDYVNNTSSKTYTLMGKTTNTTTGTVVGSQVRTVMRWTCGYAL